MLRRILSSIMRMIGVFGVLLLLLSMIFDAIPFLPNNSVNTIYRIDLQDALVQRIAKDALILTYSPTSDHAQAISELQNTLPVWEKTQNGLLNGDASLNLSPNPPSNIQLLLLQANPDYTSIDNAARAMLAHPTSSIETTIIIEHELDYFTTMAHVSQLWQQHMQDVAHAFFSFKLGIGAFLMTIWIGFIVATKSALKKNGNNHETIRAQETRTHTS